MADIPIEERSGGDMWKWLGGLALLVAVVLLIVALTDTDENGTVDDPIDQPTEQQQQQEQPPQQPQQQEQEQQQNDPPTESSNVETSVEAERLPLVASTNEWRSYTASM